MNKHKRGVMNKHKVCAVAGALAGAALLAGACADTASATSSGNGENRIGVIQGNGTAHAKKGALTASWTTESGGVKQSAPPGDWTGEVHGNGYVKEGGHSATWTWGSAWGRQITPSGDWTGGVHGNGYVEGNGFSASWSW
jgi:hypothetical protein